MAFPCIPRSVQGVGAQASGAPLEVLQHGAEGDRHVIRGVRRRERVANEVELDQVILRLAHFRLPARSAGLQVQPRCHGIGISVHRLNLRRNLNTKFEANWSARLHSEDREEVQLLPNQ